MSRKKAPNGIIDTIERLIGHCTERDRKRLTNYAEKGLFGDHLSDGDSRVFNRSKACDNLIKNVLALDTVFGSRDLVAKVVKKEATAQEIASELQKKRDEFEERFKAYGYWLDRLSALEEQLGEADLEQQPLEDVLVPEAAEKTATPGDALALRAVLLLEKIEEDGRLSKLSPEKQTEKAWALYRLGLTEQARELCEEVTAEDPAHSEAWLLLGVDAQRQQQEAQREYFHYMSQREFADPMSSQESWAEDMQDDAISKLHEARRREWEIIFPAVLHWPQQSGPGGTRYSFPDSHREVQNSCVAGLFELLRPYGSGLANVDQRKAHAINGLEPEYLLKRTLRGYSLTHESDSPAHPLTKVQLQVAQLLCEEYDRDPHRFFGLWLPADVRDPLELKLLHVRFVLGLSGYEEARQRWLASLRGFHRVDFRKLMHRHLYDAFITHLSQDGLPALVAHFDSISEQVRKVHSEEYHEIRLNLLRKAYDHAFARGEYIDSIAFAKTGGQDAIAMDVDAPSDLCCNPDDMCSNSLTPKFWKYLELRAAVEVSVNKATCNVLSESLLSVLAPEAFFADEKDYMEHHADEFDDWHEAAYGESILDTGQWARSLRELLDTGLLTLDESEQARIVLDRLETLRAEEGGPDDNPFC